MFVLVETVTKAEIENVGINLPLIFFMVNIIDDFLLLLCINMEENVAYVP